MKLSVNHSDTLLDLLHSQRVLIDAIEWVDKLSLEKIRQTRCDFPDIAFHFHPGRMLFTSSGYEHLESYLRVCPQTPYISIHLAPLPILWTSAALHSNVFLPELSPKPLIRRFVRQVQRLKERVNLPIILENMPALHPVRYRFESEPDLISQVLEETGCPLLFDLAHARIAADARDISIEDYLKALPLEKTAQIHLAGARKNKEGHLYDAHQTLTEEDYWLIEKVLPRVQASWLTLEYFMEDSEALLTQINRLQKYC